MSDELTDAVLSRVAHWVAGIAFFEEGRGLVAYNPEKSWADTRDLYQIAKEWAGAGVDRVNTQAAIEALGARVWTERANRYESAYFCEVAATSLEGWLADERQRALEAEADAKADAELVALLLTEARLAAKAQAESRQFTQPPWPCAFDKWQAARRELRAAVLGRLEAEAESC